MILSAFSDRHRLYPFFIVTVIIPFIRKAPAANERGIFGPTQQVFIGFMNFTECGSLAAYIRVMNFHLTPIGIFDDLAQLDRKSVV